MPKNTKQGEEKRGMVKKKCVRVSRSFAIDANCFSQKEVIFNWTGKVNEWEDGEKAKRETERESKYRKGTEYF